MAFGLGETVGTAYVRVLMDGTGLDASIRKEVEDALDDAHLESASRKAGKDISEGMSEGFKQDIARGPGWKQAKENLRRSIRDSDFTKDYFKSPNWRTFVKEARLEFGDLGEMAAKAMEERFTQAGSLKGLADQQEKFVAFMTQFELKAQDEANKKLLAQQKAHLRQMQDQQREFLRQEEHDRKIAIALAIDDEEERFQIIRELSLNALESVKQRVAAEREQHDEAIRMNAEFDRSIRRRLQSMAAAQTEAIRMNKEFDRLSIDFQRKAFASQIGDAFGKGARNDLINIIGLSIEKITLLVSKLPILDGKLAGTATGFHKLAIGGFAVGGALSFVASTLSGLTGGATALASSLSFAAIGGVGVLAASLVPLGAAITVVTTAIAGMDDATKKMVEEAMLPLAAAWDQVTVAAAAGVFSQIEQTVKTLTPTVEQLTFVFEEIGGAVAGLGLAFADSTRGPGWQSFIFELGTSVPSMVTELGNAFISFSSGLVGMFQPAVPFIRDFTGWLAGLAQEFDNFVNSASGRNTLTVFFTNAAASVNAVWDALTSISRLLGTILNAGREEGDSLFVSLADSVNRWNDALKANPEILQQWFADAGEVTRAFGDVAVAIGKIVDALDTPGMRQLSAALFEDLAFSVGAFADALSPLIELIGELLGLFADLPEPIRLAAGAMLLLRGRLTGIQNGFTAAAAAAVTFSQDLGRARRSSGLMSGVMEGLRKNSRLLAGGAGFGLLSAAAGKTDSKMGDLLTVLGFAATGFAVGGPWGAAIGGAVGLVTTFGDSNKQASTFVEDLTASLDKQTGALTANSAQVAANELENQGLLKTAQELGLNLNDVVDAALGSDEALARVNEELTKFANVDTPAGVDIEMFKMREEGNELAKTLGDLGTKSDEARAATERISSALGASIPQYQAVDEEATKMTQKLVEQFLGVENAIKGAKQTFSGFIREMQKDADAIRRVGDNALWAAKHGIDEGLVRSMLNAGPKGARALQQLRDASKQQRDTAVQAWRDQEAAAGEVEAQMQQVADLYNSIKSKQVELTIKVTRTGNKLAGLSAATGGEIPAGASGGLFNRPTHMLIGEAGPEALVPLNRPLSQVDPAVRELSAIAQGRSDRTVTIAAPVPSPSTVIEAGAITVVTPASDARAVAWETLNFITAAGY